MPDQNRAKLKLLAEHEGFGDVDELLEAAALDSVCPGICMECGATAEVEPDQDAGWCDECDKGTIKSALVLAGLI